MADYDLQYQDNYIDVLLATANELKTAGYIFKGVATPSTNPGTPTERVAYLASEPGTYTNFGGIVIASGLYSLTYASGTWTGTQMQAGSDIEVVQTTGQSASDVMSQKAVTDEIGSINDYFTNDVRTFAIGESCSEGQVIINNGDLLTCIKDIRDYTLADEVSIGDIWSFISLKSFYKALKNVAIYTDAQTYASGDYAIVDGVVKKYDGSTWASVTRSEYAADTSMWQSMTLADVLNDAFKPYSLADDRAIIGIELFDLAAATITAADNKTTLSKWTISFKALYTTAGEHSVFVTLPHLKLGRKYRLTYEYDNTVANVNTSYFLMTFADAEHTTYTSAFASFIKEGTIYVDFTANELTEALRFASVSTAKNDALWIKNIHLFEYDTYHDIAKDVLASNIAGTENVNNYGYYNSSANYSSSASISYMSAMSPCLEDGILSEIKGKFSAGSCTFYIGHIDQNDYLVVRDSFNATTTSGENVLDVRNRNIVIYKDEYLLISYADASAKCYFGIDDTASPLAWGIDINTNKVFHFGSAVYLALEWKVVSKVSSLAEIRDDINDIKRATASNTEEIEIIKNNKKYYIEDSVTHTNYLLTVVNGVLQLVPSQFSNVTVLGNSLTTHDINERWWGTWGMAATKEEYDFCHILQDGLRVKDANAVVKPVQMAPWEKDFSLDLATLIGDNMTASTDLVVIRLGTNVPAANVSGLQNALQNLINYIKGVTNAKIVMTGMFYSNNTKENILSTVAANNGIDFIKILQLATSGNKEAVGHYVYGDDDAIHEINDSGVASHPNNKGMLAIANAILSDIGYDTIAKTYSLQEVTVGGVTGTMWVEVE